MILLYTRATLKLSTRKHTAFEGFGESYSRFLDWAGGSGGFGRGFGGCSGFGGCIDFGGGSDVLLSFAFAGRGLATSM